MRDVDKPRKEGRDHLKGRMFKCLVTVVVGFGGKGDRLSSMARQRSHAIRLFQDEQVR